MNCTRTNEIGLALLLIVIPFLIALKIVQANRESVIDARIRSPYSRIDQRSSNVPIRAPLVDALHRRFSNPSFWVSIICAGAAAVIRKASSRFRYSNALQLPSEGYFLITICSSAVIACFYLLYVYFQGETFFYINANKRAYEDDTFIRWIQIVEGFVNLAIIVVICYFLGIGLQLIRGVRSGFLSPARTHDDEIRINHIIALVASAGIAPFWATAVAALVLIRMYGNWRHIDIWGLATISGLLGAIALFYVPFLAISGVCALSFWHKGTFGIRSLKSMSRQTPLRFALGPLRQTRSYLKIESWLLKNASGKWRLVVMFLCWDVLTYRGAFPPHPVPISEVAVTKTPPELAEDISLL